MVFIVPIEFKIAFIVLIGIGMDAESTVWISFRLIFGVKFILHEGFGVILSGICHDGCGIQADKGSIQNAHLVEFFDLGLHDLLYQLVIQFPKKTVIYPTKDSADSSKLPERNPGRRNFRQPDSFGVSDALTGFSADSAANKLSMLE